MDMSAQTAESMWRPVDTLANRLILVRRQLNLTQRQAAARTGMSFGEWQSMENGAAARGVDRKVAAISAELGVDREWLMWGGPLSDPTYGVSTDRYFADSAGLLVAA